MEMTTTKTLVVFAIIFGCFAVLYPKIFHPMVLHIFGFGSQKAGNDDIYDMMRGFDEVSKIPPHLRKGPGPARVIQEDITRHIRDEHPGSFRPGPHPGLRAAAEMKKQAAATTGTGKGMMGVVLPMYAVGIVIYLIYTLTKVFGKKEEKKEDVLSNNPFSEIQYDAQKKEFKYSDGQEDSEDEREMSKPKKQQRDLERLLLRADERNISHTLLTGLSSGLSDLGSLSSGRSRKDDSYFMPLPPFRVYRPKKKAEIEMRQLKARLLETEAQMSRILKAMETVSDKVIAKEGSEEVEEAEEEVVEKPRKMPRTVDSSPDMETYEIISGTERTGLWPASRSGSQCQTVEEVGPEATMVTSAPAPSTLEEVEQVETPQEDPQEVASTKVMTGVHNEEQQEEEEEEENVTEEINTEVTPGGEAKHQEDVQEWPTITQEEDEVRPEQLNTAPIPTTNGTESSESPECTEEEIPDMKPDLPQEPRPDLRKRKQGKKAKREN